MTPELVVKLKPVQLQIERLTGASPIATPSIGLLVHLGLTMRPVRSRASMPAAFAFAGGGASEAPARRLDRYWTVLAEPDRLAELRARLNEVPEVEAAFIAPAPDTGFACCA